MNAAQADKIYRPEVLEFISSYLTQETKLERSLIFPSVQKIIETIINDGICENIIYHYVVVALEFLKIKHEITLGNLFPEILQIMNVIYPDNKNYCRSLAQQTIVMIHKMDSRIKTGI
jgi:hypothetical protein